MIESIAPYSPQWWAIFLGGVSTLAIYSFLYRENGFYRLFEHLFIGIATGYWVIYSVRSFLWPKVIVPLFGLDRIRFPDGTYSEPYNELNLLWLLPISFGLLFYCILTKRHKWLAQLVIGCQLGYAGGLAFKGTFIELLPQVFDSFKPLYIPGSLGGSLTNFVFVLTFLCALSYFYFTIKPSNVIAGDARRLAARWGILAGFLAFVGLAAAAWKGAETAHPENGLNSLLLLPAAAAVILSLLTLRRSHGPLSSSASLAVRSTMGAAAALYAVTAAWITLSGSETAAALNRSPQVNIAMVLLLCIIIYYFALVAARDRGGVVASSAGFGRWLMMGCFGAFFGSTIMARMALLVERLEFLIDKWWGQAITGVMKGLGIFN